MKSHARLLELRTKTAKSILKCDETDFERVCRVYSGRFYAENVCEGC